jgi:hypothetical protein
MNRGLFKDEQAMMPAERLVDFETKIADAGKHVGNFIFHRPYQILMPQLVARAMERSFPQIHILAITCQVAET